MVQTLGRIIAGTNTYSPWYGVTTTSNTAVGGYGDGDFDGTDCAFLPQVSFGYFIESCAKPTNLNTSELNYNSATLTWEPAGSESAWQLVYSTDGTFDPDEATPIDVTEASYTLSDLTPNTTYYVYVRANCYTNYYSDWSEVLSFTPVCAKPTNLHTESVGTTTATLAWTPGSNETAWQLCYTYNASVANDPGNGNLIAVTENPSHILTGLGTETVYYAYVRARYGESTYSDWSNLCVFTPTETVSLTVGDGTVTGDIPVPMAYLNTEGLTKSEFIIPASMLTNMKYGTIKRLTFYCDTESWEPMGFWIYVGETTETSLNADNLIASTALTYVNYEDVIIGDHKMVVPFKLEDYLYQGGNLVVYFHQHTSCTANSDSHWYGISTENQGMYYDGSSNNFVGFMPKVTISYIEGECLVPQDLDIATTTRKATLNWTAGGSETSWQLQYREGEGAWSDVVSINETPSYTISGLAPATTYEVRLRSACYSDFQSEWISDSFTTCSALAVTAEQPFEENFDEGGEASYPTYNNLPDCWSYINETNEIWPLVLAHDESCSAPNRLEFYLENETEVSKAQYAILPEMSGINALQMSFSADGDAFEVGVMDADGNYTTVKAFESGLGCDGHVVYFDQVDNNSTNIAIKLICTGQTANQNMQAQTQASLNIDDIVVSPLPTCFMPSDLTIGVIQTDGVYLSWTPYGQEANWQVQYSTNNSQWTTVEVSQDDMGQGNFLLSGLEHSTRYYVRVRANCGDNDYSEWTVSESFYTECDVYVNDAYLEDFDEVVAEAWWVEDHLLPICWQYINESTDDANKGLPTVFTTPTEGGDVQYQSAESLLLFDVYGGSSSGDVTKDDQYAILPEMPAIASKQMKFAGRAGEFGNQVSFVVGAMTDPTDASTFTAFREFTTEGIVYNDYTVYFDGFQSQDGYGYIAFKLPAVAESHAQLYIEDIAVTPAPACRMPFNLAVSEVGETSAKVNWDPNDMTQWQLQYRTENEDWTSLSLTENPPYTLSGLTANTYYYVRLRSVCSTNEGVAYSDWCDDIATFHTDCASDYQPIPYYEDFDHLTSNVYDDDNSYMTCWPARYNIFNSDDYPGVFMFGGHGNGPGELYFYMNGGNAADEYQIAVLPRIQNIKSLQMSFYAKGTSDSELLGLYYYCDFKVGVMTDPNDPSTFVKVVDVSPNTQKYVKHIISFASYEGTGEYIAIKKMGHESKKSLLHLDDIEIKEIVTYTKTFNGSDSEDRYWNDATYWSGGTLPTATDNVKIIGSVIIPDGCVAEANIVDFGTNGSLHINEGGQLKHNNMGVEASFDQFIDGYGTANTGQYSLISSPMMGSLNAKTNEYFGVGDVMGLLNNSYDLYRFSTAFENEWRNYEKDKFTIDMTVGYLYANNEDITLTYYGSLKPSNNNVEVDLLYQGGTAYAGYNLIGNPFACTAYLADNGSFFRMNDEGSALIEASGAIAPGEGVFVQATAAGQSAVFTRTQPSRQGSLAFTLSNDHGGRAFATADRARIRFGEGRDLGKFGLMASADQLYIPQGNKDYAMVHAQARGEMPLNFKASRTGDYTITVNVEDVNMAYLHLIDNLTGADVNLLETPSYSFVGHHSDYEARFKVVFSANDSDSSEEEFALITNGNIVVFGADANATLQVIDMLGRVLVSTEGTNDLSVRDLSAGVYVLRMVNGNETKTQKIVIR